MNQLAASKDVERLRTEYYSRFSRVRIFVTLRTVALQALPSVGFSTQEYWSELPCPPAGDLPDPGIEPVSLTSAALAGRVFTTSATWETLLGAPECLPQEQF